MRSSLRHIATLALMLAGPLLLGCGKAEVSSNPTDHAQMQPGDLDTDVAPQSIWVSHSADIVTGDPSITEAGNEPGEAAESSQTSGASETVESESGETVKTITFDHIKFEMTKGDKFKKRMLTDKITQMFGKSIRIRGYIRPSFKQDGLTSFIFVRDNQECCYGPGAALFDCIAVRMVDNKTTSFTVRPVTVEGVFSFERVDNPDPRHAGEILSIYRLDAVRVR
jgi:hypothetical protein